MNIITVTKENIEKEHICCAISSNKDCQVLAKKSWLSDRFEDGLVFKKGDVRGKCFIEYIPAEKAWVPIVADGYMHINCLWVSGQFKGQGNSTLLLDECIKDSREQGKKGLTILSAKKKMAFLADPSFLKHKGFKVADSAEPYYDLYYFDFNEKSNERPNIPCFSESIKSPKVKKSGYVLYYSHQCPFTAKYVPLIKTRADEKGIEFETVLFESAEQAQNAPAPFTSYSLFYNGKFITNEIMSEKKFDKIVEENGK